MSRTAVMERSCHFDERARYLMGERMNGFYLKSHALFVNNRQC